MKKPFLDYLWAIGIITLSAIFSRGVELYLDEVCVALVYLLAVVFTAFYFSLGPAILISVASVFVFDYINMPPYLEFSRRPADYLFTILVMVATAASIGVLTQRLRQQAAEAVERATRTNSLYSLAEQLSSSADENAILSLLKQHLMGAFNAHIDITIITQKTVSALKTATDNQIEIQQPLLINGQPVALITIKTTPKDLGSREQQDLFYAMLRQASLAIERCKLQQEIQHSASLIQQESLRNTILNAVSHDLRTPLASIIGASSSLIDSEDNFSKTSRMRLRSVIRDEAVHMQHMVENLLQLARLQSGEVQLASEWQAMEEIVGSALTLLRRQIPDHEIKIYVPDDLPLIRCDSILIERVLINLVENAAKYSPEGSIIHICATVDAQELCVKVIDQGMGIPSDAIERVFEPFYRINPANKSGFGLGLSICRTIIQAHGGRITITNNTPQGTTVSIWLPIPPQSPAVDQEDPLLITG